MIPHRWVIATAIVAPAACARDPGILNSGATAPHPARPWTVALGGEDTDSLDALATDRAGNVIVAGTFEGSMKVGEQVLNATGEDPAAYLVKYTGSGGLLWARVVADSGGAEIRDLKTTHDGEILVVGTFRDTLALGGLSVASRGGSDAFAARLTGAGDAVWLAGFGGEGIDAAERVVLDAGGTLVVAGAFSGQVDLGGGTVIESLGGTDIFLLRLDPLTGAIGAMGTAGGAGMDAVSSLSASGDAMLVGGTFRTDLSVGDRTLSAVGGVDAFAGRLEPTAGMAATP